MGVGRVEAYGNWEIHLLTASILFSNDKSFSNSRAFIHQLNPHFFTTNYKPVGFGPLLCFWHGRLNILFMLKVV